MSVTRARETNQNETCASPQWGLGGTTVPGTSKFPHLAFVRWPRTPDRQHTPASGASSRSTDTESTPGLSRHFGLY